MEPKYVRQHHNKYIEVDPNNYPWLKENKCYKRGIYEFTSDTVPVCKLCGAPLEFEIKQGRLKNYVIIHKCLNENCESNKYSGNAMINKKAFLPEHIINEFHNIKSSHTATNIDYLVNYKGFTEEEATNIKNSILEKCKQSGYKNKGKSKRQIYINKYGEKEGLRKMYIDNPLHVEHWTNKGFTEEEAKNKISEIQQKNSKKAKHTKILNKEYIKKLYNFSDEEVNDFCKKRSTWSKEFWISRGFTEEEAINKVSEIQSKNANKIDKSKVRERSKRCKEYWLSRGFTEEEAIENIKNIQTTFSLEICINKYGEVEGRKIFNERQLKWQQTLTNNTTLKVGYSKVSQILFFKLLSLYKTHDNIYFAEHNREFYLRDNNKKIFVYDFCDNNQKKIIEFQGDNYHANPELYTQDTHPFPYNKNLTAKDIWDKDAYKQNVAKEHGYDILYIWERDFKINDQLEINKCIKFLNLNNE